MASSDTDERGLALSRRPATAGLTALVALALLGATLLIPLETRNARGEEREMTAFEVWRETLGNLPDDAPFFLNAGVLTVLIALALVASAYVIVAILRMSR